MRFGFQRARLVEILESRPVVGRVVRALYDGWLALQFRFGWRFGCNSRSRSRFRKQTARLSPVQQGIVEELRTRGVAITSFDALLGDRILWDRLIGSVRSFAGSDKVRTGVEAYRRELRTVVEAGSRAPLPIEQARRLDKYWVSLYPDDEIPSIRLDNEWLRLSLDPAILGIVNAYFGLWSRLIYFDLWHTIPVGREGSRFGSQRWHRDPEDLIKLRFYLYFSEVDESAGPLQYVPGSQRGGPFESAWPWRGPVGKNTPPQEEFEKRIPSSAWVTCAGRAGTLVFCDTIGLHRGGVSTEGTRLLATGAFVTPASLHRQRYRVDWDSAGAPLAEEARFAVTS